MARTAPYIHDSSIKTLGAVIDYYDRGAQRNPGLDHRIRPLGLAAVDKEDLRAFLESLTGRIDEGR